MPSLEIGRFIDYSRERSTTEDGLQLEVVKLHFYVEDIVSAITKVWILHAQLMFEKDISQLAKPQIKGRGFVGSGQEIIETQTYYTQPENDWIFDDTQLLTYENPVYLEQCKRKGVKVDDSGFIPQKPLDEEADEEEMIDDDEDDIDDIDDDDDIDIDDSDNDFMPSKIRPKMGKPEPPKEGLTLEEPSIKPKFTFGNKENDSSSKDVESKTDSSTIDNILNRESSNRDKVLEALGKLPDNNDNIKVISDPSTDSTSKPGVRKLKLTLNNNNPQ